MIFQAMHSSSTRKPYTFWGWAVLGALLFAVPTNTAARSTDFELWTPPPAPDGMWYTESAHPYPGDYSVGGYVQLAKDPVVMATANAGRKLGAGVFYRLQARATAAWTLWPDRFHVGLDLPVTLLSDDVLRGTINQLDPKLHNVVLKGRGLMFEHSGFAAGLGVDLAFATGEGDDFAGTDYRFAEPTFRLALEQRIQRWAVRANLAYAERDDTVLPTYGLEIRDRFQYRVGVAWEAPLDIVTSFELAGSNQFPELFANVRHDALEAVAGAQYRIRDVVVGGAAATGLSKAYGVPSWRLIGGVFWALGSPAPYFSPERIGDGPNRLVTLRVHGLDGLPVSDVQVRWHLRGWTDQRTTDQSGVVTMPTYPGPVTVVFSGPSVYPTTVTLTESGKQDFQSRVKLRVKHATLTVQPRDRESGAPVAEAVIYLEGSDRSWPVDEDRWSAPLKAGSYHFAVRAPGYYPRRRSVHLNWGEQVTETVRLLRRGQANEIVMSGGEIYIGATIHFGSNSAKILDKSHALLNRLAGVLKKNPGVGEVLIKGYTDDVGTDRYNLELSQARADAVRRYLIRKGVAPDRLEAVGRGQAEPLASNATEEGRILNRRVEFEIQ